MAVASSKGALNDGHQPFRVTSLRLRNHVLGKLVGVASEEAVVVVAVGVIAGLELFQVAAVHRLAASEIETTLELGLPIRNYSS